MERNPTISQLKDLKHFTARWLKKLKEVTGIELHILAGIIIAIMFILLIQGEQSQHLANALLIAVPILLFVAYPKECPSIECMVVYSASYALLTLLDSGIEQDWQSYYLFKVFMLSLLFLKPFNGATRILELIEKFHESPRLKDCKEKQPPSCERMKMATLSETDDVINGEERNGSANKVLPTIDVKYDRTQSSIRSSSDDDTIGHRTLSAEITIPIYIDITESQDSGDATIDSHDVKTAFEVSNTNLNL